jgi:membrane protein implicated in regulation of membrane protease activity
MIAGFVCLAIVVIAVVVTLLISPTLYGALFAVVVLAGGASVWLLRVNYAEVERDRQHDQDRSG